MNNKCKNFRQRTRTKNKKRTVYLYCTELRKEITFDDCKNCDYVKLREYKTLRSNGYQIKSKSRKLAKLERDRFSLFSDNDSKCFICGSDYDLTWHELFRGRNRSNSMKFGLCLRLCLGCHEKYQEDKEFNDDWHIKGQVKFEEIYPDLEFIDIFGRNYK